MDGAIVIGLAVGSPTATVSVSSVTTLNPPSALTVPLLEIEEGEPAIATLYFTITVLPRGRFQ